ncbi:MAG: Rrf2 family transcriptional regulator [Zetaproteobacteria bacterium CG_4_9_14_3_um_filter_49_83]|nr:MAG: Rrf2 family transcriptional regulator [Zetaproteobacteria bacterium CG1_02_49_23]PIQ31878.1 MAG: Rrf2 family transcriptional regulator [Zetaproteobacteria bacterium CG17_big_fil_post_rev_8_21_14_2_50_50_13]PIV30445.1 MAG: Rrf2 family transcriptional regulator [Zetaproteobacteria bacterium CG02_land_8_20_14_3_00_50_9]PIY55411.1 MAG: Rrf2 family transcriptional regulator [Zetaproteobacteria bacterium CG_4_10_14_0_8_um_filter_49_80]PJA34574.1 MAG: Rrf2 family transcriptional regulator [Zet
MRLTSKGRYAVSAMVDLNNHASTERPVTLSAISERQFISLSYLEQLFRSLRLGGLVKSVRGPGGGYLLARPAKEITVADVIRAANEPIRTTLCENAVRGCHRGKRCDTHQLWQSLGQHIYRFLDAVNLQQVCDKQVALDEVDLGPVESYLSALQSEVTAQEIVMADKGATVS